jgi:hypothetical protein
MAMLHVNALAFGRHPSFCLFEIHPKNSLQQISPAKQAADI